MTNQGAYLKPNQSAWFPLSLLQVGNRTNLTTYSTTTPELFTKDTKPLTFSDTTPIFYGIAPVGATITLTLNQDQTDDAGNTNRQQVTSESTNANDASEWGINLETPLTTGTYYLTIQATDSSDNFAILKDIPIQLGTSSLASNSKDSAVLGANDQDTNTEEADTTSTTLKQVTPTPTTPTPSPTPQPKWWQFWKWF